MELLRKIWFRISHIGLWLTVLCILACVVLVFVTWTFNVSVGLHIFTYIFVAFTAINILVPLPDHVYKVKAIIYKNSFATKYVYDYEYRSSVVMQIGFLGNTVYALFTLFLGLISKSAWFTSIGVFYAIFGFLKFALLLKQNHILKCENTRERKAISFRVWRFFGISMLIITIPTTVMVVQMIYHNKNYYYGDIITFGYFIYTSIYFIAAVVKVFQAKMRKNPIFTAYSNMSFCGALMSILALQTAMVTGLGIEDSMRRIVNSITGGIVLTTFYIVSIVVIVSTTKVLRKNYPELSTYLKHKEYKESTKTVFDSTLELDAEQIKRASELVTK
ncbi:MAG: hypothetical protein IJF11_03830 [Clostridia bacterium]|nr:hypothetical protein [Clostridia bacterium]